MGFGGHAHRAFPAAVVMTFTACVKEQAPTDALQSENLVPMEFTAFSDAETKTSLAPGTNNKTSVVWNAGDKVSVWDGTANREFTVTSCEGSSAVLTGFVAADATSFYAIYPYTSTLEVGTPDNVERDIRFRFPITSTEYAQPGDFPVGRGIAVAVAVDGKFAFQNRTCLLKFSLASDMANVKSISIKGNNGEYIWGTVNVEFAGTTVSQGMAYGYDRGDEVTLCNQDGTNLQTGVDYYIALPGINFTKGYTVTVKYDDNSTASKTSDKAIQMYTKNIYSLSSAPISKDIFVAPEVSGDSSTSYYAAYMEGQDIVIAGKTYNKTTHPNATLLTKTTSITANGLYFLAPEEGQTITLGTTAVGNIVIVGDNPSARTEIVHSGFRLNAAAKVAALNIIFPDYGQQLVQEATAGADYVAFDNCKIYPTSASSAGICYNGTSAATAIKEFVMVNSEYVFSKATARRDGAMMLNCVIKDASITLHNNMFYVNEPNVATWKFKLMSVPGKAASLVMTNNTFVDMLVTGGDAGYSKTGVDYESMNVQDNLFYVSQSTETKNQFVFNGTLTPSSITVNNNAYYQVESITTQFNMFGTTPEGQQKTPTKLTESPFSSMDHANGVFVKTAAAASYGAKR